MYKYRVTIGDRDGEYQDYDFLAPTPWHVLTHIRGTMASRGDFYGHKADETTNVDIAELWHGATVTAPTILED